MSVKVGFLGGLGEIGRNCALIEVDGKIMMIDCGLMFPEEDMFGVDLVLPDFSAVTARRKDFLGVVLTHGHEDHIGAISYLLREVKVPIFGTPLTLKLVRPRVEEASIEPDLRPIPVLEWVEHGPFRFTLVRVTHSVPDAAGVVFDTPEGIIIHSGDFKLDPTPLDRVPTDLGTFAGFARRGVRLLLSDSTNAERPGYTGSETSVGKPMRDIVRDAPGRVIIACFASHLHRVQQAVDAVTGSGRMFAFLGRSMLRNSEVAMESGHLVVPDGHLVDLGALSDLPAEKTAVICTGSQGEPFAALSLMASGQHRTIALAPDDTVILSATPIPGNETKVSRVINNLLRLGVDVYHGRNAPVHVSGHASQEELKTFLNVVQPQALIPVHGEYRHLRAHAELASDLGVPEVEILEDGDQVVLEGGKLQVQRAALPSGYVFIDGFGIGDVEDVLRDRRHLADDGVLIVTVGIDRRTGEITLGPDVDSHGVSDDTTVIHNEVAKRVADGIAGLNERPLDIDTLRTTVRRAAGRAVKATVNRRPVVIPVVLEV